MKAAALMDSLINNHPLVDGNNRTGVTAARLFLRINGRKLSKSSKVLEAVTLHVATKDMQIAELTDWLKANSVTIKGNN
jgi:death on curing protein